MTQWHKGSMFWRLWWRAVSVKRSQAALGLGALMVGAALASMLLNLYSDVRRKMTEDFRAYGANVVISPRAKDAGNPNEVMEASALDPLAQFARATPGTLAVPILYGVVRVSRESADPRLPDFASLVAAGADFAALRRLNPGWRETGKDVRLAPGECAVGANLAAQLHLRAGDPMTLSALPPDARSALECGGLTPPSPSPAPCLQGGVKGPPSKATSRIATVLTTGAWEDNQVFLPLAALASLLGMEGKVTLVQMSIPGETRDVERAVRRLAGLLPGLEVRPVRQIVYSEGKVLSTIRWLLLSLTILILVIIALCVMATMTTIVLERRKDIGVMKALGARDALLARLFMAESAGLGLAAGVLGFGLGAWLARTVAARLFGVALSLHPWTLPAVCGLSVALAVLGAQAPVRIVRALQPAVVLKGE